MLDLATNTMQQQSNWKKGNYTGLKKSIGTLAKATPKELDET